MTTVTRPAGPALPGLDDVMPRKPFDRGAA